LRPAQRALQHEPADAPDDNGMSTREERVCEICGQPLDDGKSMVVVMVTQGQEFVRHRRCHMLDLLKRA
jgi:hypothetical protein